jgi:CysZ protein
MGSLLQPLALAVSQIGDRVFLGVLLRSLAWSFACFIVLLGLAIWAVHRLLDWHGPWAWLADVAGTAGASLFALWLFLPLAAAIGTLYFERIAHAVEARFYPLLPPPEGAPLTAQIADGMALAGRILLLNVLALFLAFAVPGIGLVLGWAIAAYAIGRGLFVAVAMRRMPRGHAELLYRRARPLVLAQGGVLALAAYVPLLNLLIPVVGTAAMVHVLDQALTRAYANRCG